MRFGLTSGAPRGAGGGAARGGRPWRLVVRALATVVALSACRSGQPPPTEQAAADSQWTAYTSGLPADSFPLPSRRFSSIVAPRWTSEFIRDAAREAETVMDALELKEGMVVADIGAGDGYYVLRMAQRVGASGHVFGEDIVADYLDLLSERVQKAQLGNVTIVRGAPHDPRLPADTLDAATMIHMYHEITDPYALLWNLAHSLRAGARVGILDTSFPTDQHGTPPWLLECELAQVGYIKERSVSTGEDEYLAIFRAPARDRIPSPAALRATVREGRCLQR